MSPARLLLPVAFLGLMLALAISDSNAASAGDVTHPSVVGEVPRLDIPKVLEGYVYSSIQLHDRVIVAGDFSRVRRPDGTIAARDNIMAYNINSGRLIENFAPNVNGPIWSLKAGDDPGIFFAGGEFTSINGTTRTRIAKFDYFGKLDPGFAVDVNSKVFAVEVANDMVFIGGAFETVDGKRHARIAALDSDSGDLIPGFQVQAEGVAGRSGAKSVKALDIHPDGIRLLVVHNAFELVDHTGPKDHLTTGVAMVNIDNFKVTDWHTRWFELTRSGCREGALQLRDGEFSPDGSMFVVVDKGDLRCNKVVAFRTSIDPSPEGNPAKWVTAAHNSVFSVGITDEAVYIGGHFCFLRDYGPMTAAQGAGFQWAAKPAECNTGGNTTIGKFDARYQIAALDPASGRPKSWDPRSNAQEAVFDIEPIKRGLLIGQDRDRINQRLTGLHAFIDFGGVTPPFNPPVDVEPECSAVARDDGSVKLTWNALPDTVYQSIFRNGDWIATYEDGATQVHRDLNPANGTYTYKLRIKVRGQDVTDYTCQPNPVTVGAGPNCTVRQSGSAVVISWSGFAGVDLFQVRRDGNWIGETDANTFTDSGQDVGDHTWALRYRSMGATAETNCVRN